MNKGQKGLRIKRLIFWSLLVAILAILIKLYYFTYVGETEKVFFKSDITINGLWVTPEGPGPFPAVIILHGSGGNHQQFNKAFFRLHANEFVKKGFGVLLYTKRGSGDHEIDYDYFTYKQLKDDAMAAIRYLRAREDVEQDNIGLMGISESGWFTPQLAFEDGNIKFIINRVSSPFSVRKTVLYEIKMEAVDEGFTEEEIESTILPMTDRIWQFYIDVVSDPSLANGSEREAINKELAKLNKHERFGVWFQFEKLSEYDERIYEARAKRYAYDPFPYLRKIDTPLLYVLGGKDRNMPTDEIVAFLEEFRSKENKEITIKVYPEATHYLYKWGLEDGPFDGLFYIDGYLDLLSGWAEEQLR